MLNSRIERSTDMMLEGLDRSDPYLMLEAAKEFDQGIKTMVQMCRQFQKALENGAKNSSLDNAGVQVLIDQVKRLAAEFEGIDTSKTPNKFSFSANLDMRDSDSDNAVSKVTMAAAQAQVLYDATKDAIIGIAETIDGGVGKGIFSVGSEGIVFQKDFAKVENIEEKLSLADIVAKTPEEIVQALSGSEEEGGWKEVFSDLIKQAAGGDLSDPTKKDAAEKQFLAEFQKLKDEFTKGFKQVARDLSNIEPNEDLKNATEQGGFLRSLLKSKNPYEMDPKTSEGIVSALASMSLSGLVVLTQNLISMTKDVDAALKDSIQGVQAQAETQDQENIPERAKPITKQIEEFVDDKKQVPLILSNLQEAGWNLEKDKDLSNVRMKEAMKPKKGESLEALLGDQFEEFLSQFELAVPGEDETDDPNEVEELVDDVEAEVKENPDLDAGDAVKMAIDSWEEQLSDRQKKRINAKPKGGKEGRLPQLKRMVGEVTPPEVEAPTDVQKVAIAADDWGEEHRIKDPKSPIGNPKNFSPKEMNKLVDSLPQLVKDVEEDEQEESDDSDNVIGDSFYRRWSVLAGIIKG